MLSKKVASKKGKADVVVGGKEGSYRHPRRKEKTATKSTSVPKTAVSVAGPPTLAAPAAEEAKKIKKKLKARKKKPKLNVVGSGDGVAPVVKLPKSASDASTNWKLLLSQKSAEIAKRKKDHESSGGGGAPFYKKNSISFLRRDRKNFQKRGKMSSVSSGEINSNVDINTESVGHQLEAKLIIDGEQKEAEKKKQKLVRVEPIKGLNALGCFDYTHYGHLKTTMLDEHKFLTESTPALAIDCEMVGVGPLKEDALARVSVVNEFGFCLYDTFVKPKAAITDYRTEFSGVREEDMKTAEDCDVVIKTVANLLKGRIIVGHSLKSDLDVLFLKHPKAKIRDTALYYRKKFKKPKTPSLKSLTKEYLGVDIQDGEHSSITDAQATMRLYLYCREIWEDAAGQAHNTRVKKYWTDAKYKLGMQALGGLKTLKKK